MLKLERRNGPKRNQHMPGPRYWFGVFCVLVLAAWAHHVKQASAGSDYQTALTMAWFDLRKEAGNRMLEMYAPVMYPHVANAWLTPLRSQLDTTAGENNCRNWWHGADDGKGGCLSYSDFIKQFGDVEKAQVALMRMRQPRPGEDLYQWAREQIKWQTDYDNQGANNKRSYYARLFDAQSTTKGFLIDGSIYTAGGVMILQYPWESASDEVVALVWLVKTNFALNHYLVSAEEYEDGR